MDRLNSTILTGLALIATISKADFILEADTNTPEVMTLSGGVDLDVDWIGAFAYINDKPACVGVSRPFEGNYLINIYGSDGGSMGALPGSELEIRLAKEEGDYLGAFLGRNHQETNLGFSPDYRQGNLAAGEEIARTSLDIANLARFAQFWLSPCSIENDYCDGCDIDTNGKVNLADFAEFAKSYMLEK